jgi:hypothetical protein
MKLKFYSIVGTALLIAAGLPVVDSAFAKQIAPRNISREVLLLDSPGSDRLIPISVLHAADSSTAPHAEIQLKIENSAGTDPVNPQ